MELKYIVYITINLCNGKFYIGVHKTNPEVFDGYIGCGIYRQNQATKDIAFHNAVKKYGYENFRRTIIKIFPDTEEGKKQAYELEKVLVNETLLKSKFVYNTSLGGAGSVDLKQCKTVYMFDLKGEYLRSFRSTGEAALFLDPENFETVKAEIKNNCAGRASSCNGYFFSHKKEFTYHNGNVTPVAQYTLSGKFLRYFNSITEAEYELGLTSIQQAITKKYSCGGFQWRKYEGDSSDIEPLINNFTKHKLFPILMYDKKGNFIKEYESTEACVKENPELQVTQISRVLRGIMKTHRGFAFKFKDDDIV